MNEPEHQELQGVIGVDRLIHEPARLVIVAILYAVEQADFIYLLHETALTKGNLSSHLSKLEAAAYIAIEKTYDGKIPRTICRLSEEGRAAFEEYREHMKTLIQRTVASQPAAQ